MGEALTGHWPEYLIEATLLGGFMLSACVCGVLLEHPDGPGRRTIPNRFVRRAIMGIAMGLTAVALIYSPWGMRSGAHLNPATTLTFFFCGKITSADAFFYVVAQFLGAAIGVGTARLLLRESLKHADVNHVVTLPGARGVAVAWIAELVIAFMLMFTVLFVSNDAELTRYTGLFAGGLVAVYITFEAPLSGMSLNPARTFGSAVIARQWRSYWVYLTAPIVGMLLASAGYATLPSHHHVFCAKLVHGADGRCIFHCEYEKLQHPAR